jgi:hypothetical protein
MGGAASRLPAQLAKGAGRAATAVDGEVKAVDVAEKVADAGVEEAGVARGNADGVRARVGVVRAKAARAAADHRLAPDAPNALERP